MYFVIETELIAITSFTTIKRFKGRVYLPGLHILIYEAGLLAMLGGRGQRAFVILASAHEVLGEGFKEVSNKMS